MVKSHLLATWRVFAAYHMYIAMVEPQSATGGPTGSVEAEERLFNSLALDTKKLV